PPPRRTPHSFPTRRSSDLLEDRSYRAQLLDGNIVIERTIGRMSALLNDYLIDINVFREANQDLDMYLLDVGDAWTYRNEDIGRRSEEHTSELQSRGHLVCR